MKRRLLITLALLAIAFVARYASPAFVTAQTDSIPSPITTIEVQEGYMSSLPDYGPAPELTNEI